MEEQAIDRVHRLTQKTDVIVYKLTVKDTVEERILALQEKKRELAGQAIEGGAAGKLGKLGMREILQLFRRDAELAPGGEEEAAYVREPVGGVLRARKVEGAARRVVQEHPVYGRR